MRSARLLVLSGPPASGKSTVARSLAKVVQAQGRSCATVDVDDVADCFFGQESELELTWQRARRVHDDLVASFRRTGIDLVIAHGTFFRHDDARSHDDGVHDHGALVAQLEVGFEVAAARARSDPERVWTKDPGVLRWMHEEFHARRRHREPDLRLDTDLLAVEEIVEALSQALEF